MAQVATYAVLRSPTLAALRRKADVSVAQAMATGLLPDPQFSASGDRPTVHVPGLVSGTGLTNAYALGLAEDLQALLTYPSRASAARAAADQAKLDLLWNEWQTVEQACTLYTQSVLFDQKAKQLHKTAALLLTQSDRAQKALAAGNTTLDLAGADISAALDVSSQAEAASRAASTAMIDLKMMLGLKPDAALNLAALDDPAPLSDDQVSDALQKVMKARPDLLALQAGYHSQEENVRTAILQQFPAVTLGFNRASDTSGIQTNGLTLTLNLPIFGNTQADIKVQRATRDQLKAEYQARLDQTSSDAARISREISLLRNQIAVLQKKLPEFENMGNLSQKAYTAGNLPAATYVVLQTSLSARQAELFDLKASLWSDTLALRTLVAMPLVNLPAAGDGK
jgi:outer membrane protein TolC